MANITITAAQAQSGIQPMERETGPHTIISTYSFSASITVSQMILMCKIPDGARVTDVQLYANNAVCKAGVVVLSVGTPDSIARFISSCTPSAFFTYRMGGIAVGAMGNAVVPGFGWFNDMSDNASPKYTYLQVTVSAAGTTTASAVLSTMITYTMDKSTSTYW